MDQLSYFCRRRRIRFMAIYGCKYKDLLKISCRFAAKEFLYRNYAKLRLYHDT